MLIGTYNHNIDSKNRLSIPAKWRNTLGDKVIVTTGLDSSLYLFNLIEWEKLAKEWGARSFLNEDERNINRFLLGNAYDLSIDSHGRVLIPDALAQFANLKQEVSLVGTYDKIEIWNSGTLLNKMSNINKGVNELADRLSKKD